MWSNMSSVSEVFVFGNVVIMEEGVGECQV